MTERSAPATAAPVDPMPPADLRTNTEFTATFKFTDIEATLAEAFGDRFRDYRRDYYKSLNYDENGFLPAFPLTVSFELVNRCNLDCVMCYTVNHHEPKATLGLDTLETALAECRAHGLPAAVVGMGAEPLLYKGIRDVMRAVREADVMDVFLGTNGVLLNEALSEFLVTQRVARLEISLDAATPETYERIRGKDELELIERNIEAFLEVRRRHGSKLPVLRLCFCVQEFNHHEREMFLDKWRDKADYLDFQQLVDFSAIDELRATGTVADIDSVHVEEPHCAYPFNSLHVWSNGDVTPCCTFFAKNLVVGNVKDRTLKDIWDGPEMARIRGEIRSGDLNPTCRVCLGRRDVEKFAEARAMSDGTAAPSAER